MTKIILLEYPESADRDIQTELDNPSLCLNP